MCGVIITCGGRRLRGGVRTVAWARSAAKWRVSHRAARSPLIHESVEGRGDGADGAVRGVLET